MAQSVTGIGLGNSNKVTVKELTSLANGPAILVAGRVEIAEDLLVNPPSPTATITLATPLPNSYENYIVLITGLNTGAIYVASMDNDDDDNFSEFRVIGESEGTCMYVIMKNGQVPTI